MVVIHAAFHGAGQVVPVATMFTLICILLVCCVQSRSTFTRLFRLDHELHDVPPDEENDHPSTRMPRQNLCLDSWTEQERHAQITNPSCPDATAFIVIGDIIKGVK